MIPVLFLLLLALAALAGMAAGGVSYEKKLRPPGGGPVRPPPRGGLPFGGHSPPTASWTPAPAH